MKDFLSAVFAPDFFITGQENAKWQRSLAFLQGSESVHMSFQQNQGQGHRIFVVNASPAIQTAIFLPGRKQVIRAIHHIKMAHQNHRRRLIFRQDQNRRGVVEIKSLKGNAGRFQIIFDMIGAGMDLIGPAVNRWISDQAFCEFNEFFHGQALLQRFQKAPVFWRRVFEYTWAQTGIYHPRRRFQSVSC